ncbi:MAG: polysaccharide deacetylase family protein [Anaerolineae bacterium]|nr:polysaccharide deacetylase family protein [Anaerolineae bacterium]
MSLLVYTHARRDQPKVALTFDDGPNPPRTDQVIEILASRKARATFFVLGKWAERWPQALERIVRAGHVIGNHSYLHDPDLGDFDRAEAAIAHVTGRPCRFLRAHLFHYHLCLESPFARSPLVKIVDSDVNPADWSQTDPAEIIRRTLDAQDLAGGSIIDLHDSAETENDALRLARPLPMIEALPPLIDALQARGFALVGLDEMELVEPVTWSAAWQAERKATGYKGK